MEAAVISHPGPQGPRTRPPGQAEDNRPVAGIAKVRAVELRLAAFCGGSAARTPFGKTGARKLASLHVTLMGLTCAHFGGKASTR